MNIEDKWEIVKKQLDDCPQYFNEETWQYIYDCYNAFENDRKMMSTCPSCRREIKQYLYIQKITGKNIIKN